MVSNGLSSKTNHREPDHDFVLGQGTVLRGVLVGVEEHIEGDVGHQILRVVILQQRGWRLCDGLVSDTICPCEVDVDLLDGAQGLGQVVVDVDVGVSMHRLCLRPLGILPSNKEAWRCFLCRISFIVEGGNLGGVSETVDSRRRDQKLRSGFATVIPGMESLRMKLTFMHRKLVAVRSPVTPH